MTSRERLLSALAIGPTDRVPISTYELVGFDEHSWYNQQASYAPLMDLVREKTDCLYMAYLPGPRLSNPADAVRTTDGSPEGDCVEYREHRQGASRFIRTVYHTSKGDLSSEHRIDDDIYTTWTLEHLLKTIDDLDRYLAISWELPELDLSGFAETQRRLGDRGIMMPSLSDPICVAADLYEMGQFLILALTETDRMRYLLDVEHERQMAHLRAVLEAGRKAGVDWTAVVFRICGPEYATPPYLGPEHFAMFVTPYVRRMSDLLHEYGAKTRLHSHGKIARVLDEIIKTEPDALDPIEAPPDGDITLGEVKKRIGDRVCLFGNIQLKLLEHGRPEQVRQFVVDAFEQAKAGGGYVIMPTAAPINTPLSPRTLENYRVFIETALEFGAY